MDSRRFDAIARSAAIPATRRSALGALVAGGLLGALGYSREDPAPVAAQGQGGLCVLDFVAAVRQGPSLNRPLVAGGAPGTLRGSLRFSLSGSGDLQQADLLLADGSSLPVVGQATGHGFQARIDLGQGRAVVAVGVGEQDVSRCLGRLDGPATGPEVGDLGEWHAIAGVQNLPVGSGGSGGSGASGGARENGSRPAGAAAGGGSQPTGGGRSNASGSSGGGGKRPNGGSQSNAGGTSGGGGAGGQSGPACSQGQTRCGDACVDLQTDPVNCGRCSNACPAGAECFDGSCRPAGGSSSGGSSTSAQSAQTCPSGQTRCGDACVDVQTDKAHCGQCNHPCASELGAGTCIDGVCTCAPGTTRCDNVCVNTERDPFNCGTCGTICPNDGECLGGVCEAGESDCPQGETNCSGVCVDLKTDPDNCGTCGNLCQVSPEVFNCEDGVCVPPSCDPLTDCGGLCVDLQSDPLHCGVCGTTCAQGQVCGNGTCSCPEGQILCGDSCRNGLPTADGGTVCSGGGSPPTACPPGQTLCNGACFPEGACQPADCPPGQGRCYGYCKDFMTDPGYCGSCSNACPGGICSGGACITCPAGQTPCGTACVDTRTDLANCGFCGNACGTQCLDGQCLGVGPAPTKRCALVGEACALGSDCCAGERCIFDKCYMAAEICPFGSTRCSSTKGNFCADSNNDPNFCGGCDGRCVEGAICQSGKCVAPQTLAPTVVETCPEGQDDCGSGCVDVSFDSLNCGVCFNTCAAGDTCQNGQCSTPETVDDATTLVEEEPASSCPEGQADCGGVCTDLTTDPLNCGGCFNACAAAEACQDGQCFAPAVDDTATLVEEEPPASSCPEGQVDCVGYCADILSDLYNCGGCDVICEPGNICDFGVCTVDPAAIATEGEDPLLESAPPEGDTTCAAFGEACDPASPGACCSGVCNDDGTCA